MMLQPIPGDSAAESVIEAIEKMGEDWLLTDSGDYEVFAAEVWKADGSDFQRVLVLRWPARHNKTTEHVELKLAMAPEDAMALVKTMIGTIQFLASAGAG